MNFEFHAICIHSSSLFLSCDAMPASTFNQLSLDEIIATYGTRHIGRESAHDLVGLMDFFCFSEVTLCLSFLTSLFNHYPRSAWFWLTWTSLSMCSVCLMYGFTVPIEDTCALLIEKFRVISSDVTLAKPDRGWITGLYDLLDLPSTVMDCHWHP